MSKNYIVGGIEYDWKTGAPVSGRASAPPPSKGAVRGSGANQQFYTGQQYGWQSGATALKHGLLGSEVVGSPAPAPAVTPAAAVAPAPAPALRPTPAATAAAARQQAMTPTQAAPAIKPEANTQQPSNIYTQAPRELLLQTSSLATAFQPDGAPEPGAQDIWHTGSLLAGGTAAGLFAGKARLAPAFDDPQAPVAQTGTAAVVNGQPRTAEQLEAARRSAFLGAKDSMAGIKAVQSLMGEELARRGVEAPDGRPSIRYLEGMLAKHPAKGITTDGQGRWTVPDSAAGSQATLAAMQFLPAAAPAQLPASGVPAPTQPPLTNAELAASPASAPSLLGSNARERMDAFMRHATGLKGQLSAAPLSQPASLEPPQPVAVPSNGRGQAAMAAAAAAGVELPPSPTQNAAFARPIGSRDGQGKRGATRPIPQLSFEETMKLPPLRPMPPNHFYNWGG